MMNKTDRDNWRKFLGIKDPQTALDAARIGGDIGKTAGRAGGSVGGGSFDGENPPEGEYEEGAEKGDGGADAGEKIKVGDKFDRLEDLYDCETGEKVTIDGLGEKGSEKYPTGFEGCEKKSSSSIYYYHADVYTIVNGEKQYVVNQDYSSRGECKSIISSALIAGGKPYRQSDLKSNLDRLDVWQGYSINGVQTYDENAPTLWYEGRRYLCSNNPKICEDLNDWPAVDKNHLNWNKEKGCFEPLCPELNTEVSDKYKSCEKERILCDKDGNKVKVEVDGNGVKITQAKYNQTAEFKNGKVQTVKKLTESQTEAEFK